MGVSTSPLNAVVTASFPPFIAAVSCKESAVRVQSVGFLRLDLGRKPNGRLTRLNAGLTEIEPDLEEEERDRWRTNGISPVSQFTAPFVLFIF